VPKIDVKSIASIQDVMVEQGAVKKTVKPADLVWTP
jgi:hypothetical protein